MTDRPVSTTVSPERRITQGSDAIVAVVGGEIVLLNMATGFFHQLNGVGSYVWRQIAQPQTLAELCARAVGDYDADAETCRRDIEEFVQQLYSHGLVRVVA